MRTRVILSATTLVAATTLIGSAPASAAPATTFGPAALFAASPSDTFAARDTQVDADGVRHVRMNRSYRGVPVLGGDVIAHLRADGSVREVTRTLAAPLTLAITPALSPAGANSAAAAALHGAATGTATLAVSAREAVPVLVYRAEVTTAAGLQHVLVDARTGAVVEKWAEEQTVTGTGTGYNVGPVSLETTLSGSTYQLKDPTRGNTYTVDMRNRRIGAGALFTDADNAWGTGDLASRQTLGVDAQYGVSETWDFYKEKFGRLGIAGDGSGSYNRVHFGNNYLNASWSDACFCMTYGDGNGTTYGPFVTLDVAGHEMTHGVTSRTAGLTYSGESGGLNESYSDIMGSLVEFYSNNAKDVADYLIGEKVATSGTPLRYMDDPAKDGNSARCWSSTVKNLDVHYSSGVGNHAFFLLAVGSGAHTVNGVSYNSPTCNGGTVTGIGNDAAGAIFYRALTTYMTSSTNYSGARTATLRAATDLYGASSTEYAATAAAWAAVSVS